MDTLPNSLYDRGSRYSRPGDLFGTDHDTDYYCNGQYIACVRDYTTAHIDVGDQEHYSLGSSIPVGDLLVRLQPKYFDISQNITLIIENKPLQKPVMVEVSSRSE